MWLPFDWGEGPPPVTPPLNPAAALQVDEGGQRGRAYWSP
ncbi:hypothetical protein BJ970_006358 [Saccharopolyspora phatthalungensis]|uniref:Uncharacterized protein n=1 Tax=Saccharopolyspora phatthalungensis TaxID=664693 RepID=A0A840QIY0_9PSEU|nr:hypothetical protein [Saccharopolyspora phatthalungensis]